MNSTFLNNEVGIELTNAISNNIIGNLFSQNKICNVLLENSDDNTITNNNITLSVQHGLYSINSMVNKIY